jgi:tRNA dimethylallyltransferase
VNSRNNTIFIVGPTAIGKTEASYALARRINASIVSCDSMLVYKEPEIITSKPPARMLKTIRHYFVGSVSASSPYSVFDYCGRAVRTIMSLFSAGEPVIVCGGSGLYVNALLDGIRKGPGRDQELRNSLAQKAEERGTHYLYGELQRVDPKTAERLSSNDLKRIIRALEIYYSSGLAASGNHSQTEALWGRFAVSIAGLRVKRELLYQRINQRVDWMFRQGAVAEVRRLLEKDLSFTAEKIIGIKEIKRFLDGEISEEAAGEEMKQNTRNFAKRQITWFKRDKRIQWIDVDDLGAEQVADEILKRIPD